MMTTTPDVSVILPALHPDNDYLRCLSSIRAALAGHVTYEIICVVPDEREFIEFKSPDLHIIKENASGIYGAMNQGIKNTTGRYLYFVGQDDILLPAAARAIIQGKACNADIILADVFWGERHLYKNKPLKSVLVWKNWCHQGIFYDRSKFIDVVGIYPVQFTVQADHYANIVFSSIHNLRVFKYIGCIAWYSSDGFSSCTLDMEFRSAFPALVLKKFGFIYFNIVVFRRAMLRIFRLVKK